MTKKEKEAARTWIKMQASQAYKRKDRDSMEILASLLTMLEEPDYKKHIILIGRHMTKFGSMDFTTFRQLVPNPNAKPRTFRVKKEKT